MEIITVHTTQNIDIDYETGGLGERILAYLIDISIFVALSIIGGFLAATVFSQLGAEIYFGVTGFFLLFYDLLCETILNGQSTGKIAMKIRVISADGTRPKFSQYLLRWLFRVVDAYGITMYLGGVLSIALTDKSQRIGDLVAGTVVIRTKPRTQRDKIAFAITDETYQVVFPQAGQLNDRDIALIHEVIENYYRTGNNNIVYTMADRMRQHLEISLPPNMNGMQFLQTILKDYSHITANADVL